VRWALALLIVTVAAGCGGPRVLASRRCPSGVHVYACLASDAVVAAKPAPQTPIPTNYDYDDRPRESRSRAIVDVGSSAPGHLDAKTLLVARHAFAAAERGDCRKVGGSLQLLAELDPAYHAEVVAMPAFDTCLRRR
jgi:hypothetical protein